jgi:hypothetical protein
MRGDWPGGGLAAGTRVKGEHGELAVECLQEGDRVRTVAGEMVRVVSVERRACDATALRRKPVIPAVVIDRDAFEENTPAAGLCLAADQIVRVGGLAARATALVNGVTIRNCGTRDALSFVRPILSAGAELWVGGLGCPGTGTPLDPKGAVGLRRIADRRAGTAPGPLRGNFEVATHDRLVGWVFDPEAPDVAVPLEVRVNDIAVAWAFADMPRPDLAMIGHGNGACAFSLRFAPPLARDVPLLVSVRHAASGAEVPGSPVLLAPPRAASLARLIGSPDPGLLFGADGASAGGAPAVATRLGWAAVWLGELDRLSGCKSWEIGE